MRDFYIEQHYKQRKRVAKWDNNNPFMWGKMGDKTDKNRVKGEKSGKSLFLRKKNE